MPYEKIQWQDRIKDSNGNIIQEGTPFSAGNMNNIVEGIEIGHSSVGLLATFLAQQVNLNKQEITKYKNQRILQGQATITASPNNGYFRDAETFVQVSLTGFAQINAPNYDVIVTPISGDTGLIGDLQVYDKTQNGFKVKMTGSASSVTFLWTLLNPNV